MVMTAKQVEEALKDALERLASLETRVIKLEAENELLADENRRLRLQNVALEQSNSSLEQRVAALETENNGLTGRVGSLEEERGTLLGANESLSRRITELELIHRRRLDYEDAEEIRRRHVEEGKGYGTLAQEFHISRTHVRNIIAGKVHKQEVPART